MGWWWCAYWVAKANDVDAPLEHLVRKLGGQLGVIQHDGANGVVPEEGDQNCGAAQLLKVSAQKGESTL